MKKGKKRALKKMAKAAKKQWLEYMREKSDVRYWQSTLARYEKIGWEDMINLCRTRLDCALYYAETELQKFRAIMRDIRATR